MIDFLPIQQWTSDISVMKIYYDSNMPYVEQFFSEFGEIIPFNGRDVDAKTVSDADVLLFIFV